MRYTVINDLHIFGPLEMVTFQELLDIIRASPNKVILNGDIIDLVNCKKSQILEAKAAIDFLKRERNCVYISGNHCLLYGDLPLCHLDGNVYFDHSDLISNPKRYLKFRNKKPGAGWFKRKFITPLIDSLRHFREVRPNEAMLTFIHNYKLIHPEVTHMYFAHAHPEKDIIFEASGVKVTIFSRGFHEIEVA